jgi:hypothetical protein
MPGVYITAIITMLASAMFWGGVIYLFSGHTRRYLGLLILGLPLSALVNLWIKPSVALRLGQIANIPPGQGWSNLPTWFLFSLFMLTPILEELIKVTPLLLPRVRRLIQDRGSAFWLGLTLGISFGLGEAAFVAYGVAQVPDYASLPWYALTGYASERFMICLWHGVMTSVFVMGLQRGAGLGMIGYGKAVVLHALGNAPPMLAALGYIPSWATSLSITALFMWAVFLFERLRRRIVWSSPAKESSDIFYFTRTEIPK